jgi:single-strand DNA-binding protein
MSINKVILLGYVSKFHDVITKETKDGKKMTQFFLSTSESWIDVSGKKKIKYENHNILSYQENIINLVKNYIQKGSLLYIEGQLKTSKYQDKQGNDRYTTQVVIGYGGCIKMIGSKPNNDDNEVIESKSITQQAEENDSEIPF